MAASSVVVTCPSCRTKNRVPAVVRSGHPRCARCQADLPWLVEATDDTFQGAVAGTVLTLVDLWAPWCGPCKALAPALERLSHSHAGRLRIVKVNVDDNPRVAARFDARSIPTLVFLRNGLPVGRIVGALPEHALVQRVEAELAGRPAPR
jgi:thioredoxin 2